MSVPSATCSHHPTREAVGICVRCRAAMCSDCITKIDGINHCRPCLEASSRVSHRQARARLSVPAWLAIALGLAMLSGLSWVTLEAMMPGRGGP